MEYSRVEELSTRLKLDPVILEKVLKIKDVLGAMASKEYLSSLVFKGGSALNYVYLKDGMRAPWSSRAVRQAVPFLYLLLIVDFIRVGGLLSGPSSGIS